MDIYAAARRIDPKAEVTESGGKIIGWSKSKRKKPTKAELEKSWLEIVKDRERLSYKKKRAAEYPPIGDQLDAIMKWVFTETEFEVPEELKSLAAKCMSVKAKYPKPEGDDE